MAVKVAAAAAFASVEGLWALSPPRSWSLFARLQGALSFSPSLRLASLCSVGDAPSASSPALACLSAPAWKKSNCPMQAGSSSDCASLARQSSSRQARKAGREDVLDTSAIAITCRSCASSGTLSSAQTSCPDKPFCRARVARATTVRLVGYRLVATVSRGMVARLRRRLLSEHVFASRKGVGTSELCAAGSNCGQSKSSVCRATLTYLWKGCCSAPPSTPSASGKLLRQARARHSSASRCRRSVWSPGGSARSPSASPVSAGLGPAAPAKRKLRSRIQVQVALSSV
mmetsp:Transcript_14686/g.32370  ORF Transcript_14686/g.32370 Transcript_14686/m.32370 type:complete len:287 (+) Transcript_14686:903-1763(+)